MVSNPDCGPPTQAWAHTLKGLGLAKMAAALLEAGGTLNALAAQILYVSQPLLETWLPAGKVQSIANLLEDQEENAAFIALLRKEQR